MDRREFLGAAAVTGAATLTLGFSREAGSQVAPVVANASASWEEVRGLFDLKPGFVNMASFYLASHPKPVRDAIERHRRGLDQDSHSYIEENVGPLERAVREQASKYMQVDADELAFTDSTTMGLGLLYSGMKLKPGQEILTDTRDHIVTRLAAQEGAERSGASVRRAAFYADPAKVSVDEVVNNVRRNLRDNTRLVAMTWVHSGTGAKMPVSLDTSPKWSVRTTVASRRKNGRFWQSTEFTASGSKTSQFPRSALTSLSRARTNGSRARVAPVSFGG
jgi:isopenicillin-N epimerase